MTPAEAFAVLAGMRCEVQSLAKIAALDLALAALRAQAWQPIATAPKDRMELRNVRAVGGWQHPRYGWIWGPLDYHPDKHAEHGGYFMAAGNEPSHWLSLLAPPEPTP